MCTTHNLGTGVLRIDADHQSAILRLPRTWDGEYERDFAAALLLLARSGMPHGTPYEFVDGPDADRLVFSWRDTPEASWPASALSRLRADALGPLVPSELRDEIRMVFDLGSSRDHR